VKAIRSVAESLGFPSSVEKPLADGGYVDIEVVTPGGPVAFEVCITTETGHEAANLLKCSAAGYRRVVTVCRGKKKAAEMLRRLEALPVPDGVAVEQLSYPFAPGSIEKLLAPAPDQGAPDDPGGAREPGGKPRVFGSRRVASHFGAAEDPGSRRLAERALKLIEELMARPKPPEEQP
jgi:hypothetical protein